MSQKHFKYVFPHTDINRHTYYYSIFVGRGGGGVADLEELQGGLPLTPGGSQDHSEEVPGTIIDPGSVKLKYILFSTAYWGGGIVAIL